MKKYLLSILLLLISPLAYSTGTYYLDPFELSLKGALPEPYNEYHVLLTLSREARAIKLLEIHIGGAEKTIPVAEFSHIKGIKSRTLVVGAKRGESRFTQSKEGQTMHFSAYEFLVLDLNFEDEKNCNSGYRQMSLELKLSDLSHKVSEICLNE